MWKTSIVSSCLLKESTKRKAAILFQRATTIRMQQLCKTTPKINFGKRTLEDFFLCFPINNPVFSCFICGFPIEVERNQSFAQNCYFLGISNFKLGNFACPRPNATQSEWISVSNIAYNYELKLTFGEAVHTAYKASTPPPNRPK